MTLFYKLLGVFISGGGVPHKIHENWAMINSYDSTVLKNLCAEVSFIWFLVIHSSYFHMSYNFPWTNKVLYDIISNKPPKIQPNQQFCSKPWQSLQYFCHKQSFSIWSLRLPSQMPVSFCHAIPDKMTHSWLLNNSSLQHAS